MRASSCSDRVFFAFFCGAVLYASRAGAEQAPAPAPAAPPGPAVAPPAATTAPANPPATEGAAPAAAAPPATPVAAAEPQVAPQEAPPLPPEPEPMSGPLDEEEPPPMTQINGHVEAGYDLNLANDDAGVAAPLRLYDAFPGFKLRNAHLAVSHSFTEQASAYISLDFGTDATFNRAFYVAEEAAGLAPVDVREGYAKWTPGATSVVFGKFAGALGIEVIDGPMNPTITRGFLFRLAMPTTHTGAKATYAIAGNVAHVGLGVANGWNRMLDDNDGKTALFEAAFHPDDNVNLRLSGTFGPEREASKDRRFTIDFTGLVRTDSLTFNVQALYGSEQFAGAPTDRWYGVGFQPFYTADIIFLGARFEYFNNEYGSRTQLGTAEAPVTDVSVFNFTIAPGVSPAKGLGLRAEYRIDAVLAATVGGVTEKNVLFGESTMSTVSLGAHYVF